MFGNSIISQATPQGRRQRCVNEIGGKVLGFDSELATDDRVSNHDSVYFATCRDRLKTSHFNPKFQVVKAGVRRSFNNHDGSGTVTASESQHRDQTGKGTAVTVVQMHKAGCLRATWQLDMPHKVSPMRRCRSLSQF